MTRASDCFGQCETLQPGNWAATACQSLVSQSWSLISGLRYKNGFGKQRANYDSHDRGPEVRRSEQFKQEWQLLVGIPGQIVVLGVAD